MKLKSIIIMVFLSICLSAFAYIMDDEIPNPNLAINLGEFVTMTFLIFGVIFIIYFGIIFSFKKVKILFS